MLEGLGERGPMPRNIVVYDASGQPQEMDAEDWAATILPEALASASDPEHLYNLISLAIQAGVAPAVAEAAERLDTLEPGSERSTVARAAVAMAQNRDADARAILERYRGTSAVVLTNLAKLSWRAGNGPHALTLASQAVEAQPNEPSALGLWQALLRQQKGDEAAYTALSELARRPDAWRAMLEQTKADLASGKLESALERYARLVKEHGDHGELMLSLVRERANLEEGARQGLARYLEPIATYLSGTGDAGVTRVAGSIRKGLAAARMARTDESVGPQIVSAELSSPLWTKKLQGVALPKRSPFRKGALLFALADTAGADDGKVHPAGPERNLLRALPAFVAERLELSENWTALALVPVARGQGFYVSNQEWPLATLRSYVPSDANADALISGTFHGVGPERRLEMVIHGLARQSFPVGDDLATRVADWVESTLEVRPVASRDKLVADSESYLTSLGFLLTQLLVANGLLSPSTLWNEVQMYEAYLELEQRHPDVLACQLMLVAGVAVGQSYASPEAAAYVERARAVAARRGVTF